MSASDASTTNIAPANESAADSTHANRSAPSAMLTFHSLALHPFARRLAACCQSIHQQGFAPGTFACFSARDEGLRWITPHGVSFGASQPECLIVSWPDETIRLAAPGLAFPSVQAALHDALYSVRPDCLSIIQAPLPPAIMAAFQASRYTDASLLPLPIIGLDTPLRIAIAPALEQSGGELPLSLLPLAATHDVIVTRSHGVLVLAATPEAAVATLEQVHWVSRSISLS
jgi:ribulose-5-phosphate 4-epimerase/fuculose-1-phosphate aldolase